jgi:hypothetical protein
MTTLTVNTQVYFDAAAQCSRLADQLGAAFKTLDDALAGCGGMAGYNWAAAEYNANPDPTTRGAAPTLPGSYTDEDYSCYAPPPTAEGSNGDGLDSNLSCTGQLLTAVSGKGAQVPNADSEKLSAAASAWDAFAAHNAVSTAAATIKTISGAFSTVQSPDVADITDHFAALSTAADTVHTTAAGLAKPLHQQHDDLIALRNDFHTPMTDLGAALAAALTGAVVIGVIAVFTFGAAAVAEGGVAAAIAQPSIPAGPHRRRRVPGQARTESGTWAVHSGRV